MFEFDDELLGKGCPQAEDWKRTLFLRDGQLDEHCLEYLGDKVWVLRPFRGRGFSLSWIWRTSPISLWIRG